MSAPLPALDSDALGELQQLLAEIVAERLLEQMTAGEEKTQKEDAK